MTGVNLEEAKNTDLKSYKNLNSFFRREIREEVRNIKPLTVTHLVSPVDGTVLSQGRLSVDNDFQITQVKGYDFSLKAFLGPQTEANFTTISNQDFKNSLLLGDSNKNDLFYSVIYLAPGDYHRFHSPTEWKMHHRRHFPGDLFSVNPKIASWLKNLFALNERVCFNGAWQENSKYFSYTAVGATLVGSMKIYHDKKIHTSKPYYKTLAHKHKGIYFDKVYEKHVNFKRNDMIGEFNIGSTVVLIFEEDKNFKFNFKNGDKVQLGQNLGQVS